VITFALTVVAVYMAIWFLIGQILRRNDVADIAWGLGFVVLAWALYFERPSVQLSLAVILVTVWGARLAVHVFMRNRKKPEDFRYAQWRKDWGKWFIPRSFIQVYMLQGLLLVLISAPLIAMSTDGRDSLNVVHAVGVLIWLVGIVFESVGDYQLSQFIQTKKKDDILRTGLWRYTRHPNYFGEVMQWWGIWVISYGTSLFAAALIGPVTITVLILKVSGVPMLERKYRDNAKYQDYKRRTSKFIPLPVKKG